MKISVIKQSIMLCRLAGVTPFIWGHRGLGKSQVTDQVATDNKLGFSDWRLSQSESSDLRGMPMADKEMGITRFLPPQDLPQGGMTWETFIDQLQIGEGLMKALNGSKEKMNELLNAEPTILENPIRAIGFLASIEKWEEADRIAKLRAILQPRLNKGILFLDEINRAQDDVIQAVFQLVLDRRLGCYTLPSGWSVVCAGNYMEGYMTNGFTDPAFLNRFSHITFEGGESTLEEWVGYMAERHGARATDIIEFASQNPKHLDGDIKGELGFSVQPSRRSWEAVIRVESSYELAQTMGIEVSDDARMGVIGGLVGRELALSYVRYNCPVRPRDLMKDGVEKHKKQMRALSRGQKTGLMWGLASFLKGKVDDDKNAKVAMDFARFLASEGSDKDIAVAFCNIMVGGSNHKARAALVSNPAVARLIGKFRGPDVKKTFADRLNEDPDLQTLLSKAAWGNE